MRKLHWIGYLACSLSLFVYLLACRPVYVFTLFEWHILGKPKWLNDPVQARNAIFSILKKKYKLQKTVNSTSYECGEVKKFDLGFVCDEQLSVEEARLLAVRVYLECIRCLTEQKTKRKGLRDLCISSNLLRIKLDFKKNLFYPYSRPYVGIVYVDLGYVEYLTNLGCYGYVAEPSHIESINDAFCLSKKNVGNDLQETYKNLHFDSMTPPSYANKINNDAERFQKDQSGYSSRKFILENPP